MNLKASLIIVSLFSLPVEISAATSSELLDHAIAGLKTAKFEDTYKNCHKQVSAVNYILRSCLRHIRIIHKSLNAASEVTDVIEKDEEIDQSILILKSKSAQSGAQAQRLFELEGKLVHLDSEVWNLHFYLEGLLRVINNFASNDKISLVDMLHTERSESEISIGEFKKRAIDLVQKLQARQAVLVELSKINKKISSSNR